MAGLTAAAYLCKAQKSVIIFEKQQKVGGLVNSFWKDGFLYDAGLRSIESSGIIIPMLKQLGIDIDFVRSRVSVGLKNDVLTLNNQDSLNAYETLLKTHFPDRKNDIDKIIDEIRKIMGYMDVLYGIENPAFLDRKSDPEYIKQELLPWLLKYIKTIPKVNKLNEPVDKYLNHLSEDQSLIDMIAQHFFKETPTFFALSYFSLYLDYCYPKGGTGVLPEAMKAYILSHGGEFRTENAIRQINMDSKTVCDEHGKKESYSQLIWAADLKALYNAIDIKHCSRKKLRRNVLARRKELSTLRGGDSIFTLYLATDIPREEMALISSEHFFYTPDLKGLTQINRQDLERIFSRDCSLERSEQIKIIKSYLKDYFLYNTFEISIPVMRDDSLAPQGKSAMIISTLFDYDLTLKAKNLEWYKEMKLFCRDCIISSLSKGVYSDLDKRILDSFSSTPLTLASLTGNTDGGITGWAFNNPHMPVHHTIPKMGKSMNTGLPCISQAGQWTYSPSGLPISVMTGKLAADKALK